MFAHHVTLDPCSKTNVPSCLSSRNDKNWDQKGQHTILTCHTSLSFVGPAMSDAISNLGGGGLSSPWLANLANCLNYACSFIVTIIGGPLINKMGIKWACFIAALAFPLYGSSYYTSARFSVQWYLLFANVCSLTVPRY